MTISKLPQFTPKAAEFWATIPTEIKPQLLANVFCSHCCGVVKITDFKGTVKNGDLVLNGSCAVCGNEVARFIEGSGS
ncbi:hypothetical protein [Methyloglobulus sp.]|uniref:hypothetical protein n=1 Tax=Methyloglobulus sp. TaxID=2518622 RepID=UPI00398992FB